MARKPRLFVAGVPYHVIQRGNNKGPIFFSDNDRIFFLEVLQEAKIKHPCLIYSYCLMSNHFHLLIEPKEKENISLLMKLLGAKYVHYVNKAYRRTGTLWEGRFKCSIVGEEEYFLSCVRYIETNPMRAGIVDYPESYRWSSFRARAFGEKNYILNGNPWFSNLGYDIEECRHKYRQLFQNQIPEATFKTIREMTNRGGIVGSVKFKERIEELLHQKITIRPPGRPRKQEK